MPDSESSFLLASGSLLPAELLAEVIFCVSEWTVVGRCTSISVRVYSVLLMLLLTCSLIFCILDCKWAESAATDDADESLLVVFVEYSLPKIRPFLLATELLDGNC